MIILEKLETNFQSKAHPKKLYAFQLHTVLISSEPVSNFRVIEDQKCKIFLTPRLVHAYSNHGEMN